MQTIWFAFAIPGNYEHFLPRDTLAEIHVKRIVSYSVINFVICGVYIVPNKAKEQEFRIVHTTCLKIILTTCAKNQKKKEK